MKLRATSMKVVSNLMEIVYKILRSIHIRVEFVAFWYISSLHGLLGFIIEVLFLHYV